MIQLEEKLYTSTEVADILGVSLRSVYRYLEEGKIDAEVKTATGRHRFSKKNILDFLYPEGEQTSSVTAPVQKADKPAMPAKKKPEPVAKPSVRQPEPEPEPEVAAEDEVQEEPIDWLAKFREAAKKYREEAAQEEPSQKEGDSMSMADTLKVSEEPAFAQEPPKTKTSKQEVRKNFYRSNLGGLKDIAQNLDRGARNSYLDYAFTMSAGLSLFKPIKPFSVLHAYVREGDVAFFEKLLGLTPTDETNAQLCLLVMDDDNVFSKKEELHGLYVVDKKRLLSDIQAMGDSSLISEASSILK
jgi:excisionase family DNA binding protein